MSVSVIGVVGAGLMGSGIAEPAAAAGKHAIVYERYTEAVDRSRKQLATFAAKSVSRSR
jgi:3-hydroxyacyl-CoA dehydrogenase